MSLRGKVALITGASSGIGQVTAELLAKNKAKVGLVARRIEKLEEIKKKIESGGGKAMVVQCDVTKKEEVFEAVEKIKEKLGTIDILINNAGIGGAGFIKSLKLDEWLEVVDVNIIGTLHCYAATLDDMVQQGGGHIVNMSSVAARAGGPAMSAYCGSKSFMQAHSTAMRQELAPLGVKVTVIQPGPTKTEIFSKITDEEVVKNLKKIGLDRDEMKDSSKFMEVKDVAEAILFALVQPDKVALTEICMASTEVSGGPC